VHWGVRFPFRSQVSDLTRNLIVLSFSYFEDINTPLCHGITGGGPLRTEYRLE